MNSTPAALPIPKTRARLDVDRIGACGNVLQLGNSTHINNRAGLKCTYNVDIKELARNLAKYFIISHSETLPRAVKADKASRGVGFGLLGRFIPKKPQ